MTPATIITNARYIVNDAGASLRQSDAELLTYVNDAMAEAVIINPALFSERIQHTVTSGTVDQTLSPDLSAALIEIIGINGGSALTPFDVRSMDAFNPAWRSATAGTPRQWAKVDRDPRKFYLDVPPATAISLDVRHAKVPTVLALGDTITDLSPVYASALAWYVVAKAESKDDEHVLSERAAAAYQQFVAQIKG